MTTVEAFLGNRLEQWNLGPTATTELNANRLIKQTTWKSHRHRFRRLPETGKFHTFPSSLVPPCTCGPSPPPSGRQSLHCCPAHSSLVSNHRSLLFTTHTTGPHPIGTPHLVGPHLIRESHNYHCI